VDDYRLELVWYEASGGSSCEVYYAPGVVFFDNESTQWKLIGDLEALTPVLPPQIAGGPPVDGGEWGIHVASDLGGTSITDLQLAVAALEGAGGTHSYDFSPVLNHIDPENPGTGGIFGNDRLLPGNTPADDNDFAVHARALIQIPANGFYTFAVKASDGFALRIKDGSWLNRSGPGGIDPADPSTLVANGVGSSTGPTELTTRGSLALPAGPHEVEFVTLERDRDSSFELYATAGNVAGTGEYVNVGAANGGLAAPNAAQPYRLVGYKSPGSLSVLGVDDAHELQRSPKRRAWFRPQRPGHPPQHLVGRQLLRHAFRREPGRACGWDLRRRMAG
jgi:hypothetical protein